jgi:hypothetical protein
MPPSENRNSHTATQATLAVMYGTLESWTGRRSVPDRALRALARSRASTTVSGTLMTRKIPTLLERAAHVGVA